MTCFLMGMDTGKYVAANLLYFKKGFNGLESVGDIEWKTLQESGLSFGDLKFKISFIERELKIIISPLDKGNWSSFKEYFQFAQRNPDIFYGEHCPDTNFLKSHYEFLKNRQHIVKSSKNQCIIESDPKTNNKRKIAESIFYSIVIPFTKYKSFSSREL